MKARELTKQSITIEEIYESIKNVPKNQFKWFIPHFIYVSEEVKNQLMRDGFDLTIGDWDNVITNALIIKW